MAVEKVTDKDNQLIKEARDVLRTHFVPGTHEVAVAMRMASGNTYYGVNFRTHVDTAGIHAEPIALGQALLADDTDIETSVAVHFPKLETHYPDNSRESIPDELPAGQVLSACGICRELIADYSPNARVIVPSDDEIVKYPISDLLPAHPWLSDK